MADTSGVKESETELAALLEEGIHALSEGFSLYDAKHRLIFANEASHRNFGTGHKVRIKGGRFVDSILAGVKKALPDLDHDHQLRIAQGIEKRLVAGEPLDLTTDDGRTVRATYRRISGGRFVAISTDITTLRQREAEIEEARTAAVAANDAKSAFLANISHEIRTPLNGILGMAQVLAAAPLMTEQKEQVDAILDSGRTLMAILNDVLDLSKIEAGRLEIAPVDADLNHVLNRIGKLWGPKAEEKGITLTLDIDGSIPPVIGFDPVRVRQCLSNLVSNAIKFTSQGGVRIEASTAPEAGGGAFATIRVRDTGIGMSPETLEGLFTPFTQGNKSIAARYGGTGLGLSITRDLARLMGGDVVADSRPGEGATFTLTFRAAPPGMPAHPEGGRPPAEREARAFEANGKTVLLVDDHPLNRKVARLFVEGMGFAVVEAESGEEALRTLGRQPVDLVLLDIHMPGMDGAETVKRIRVGPEPWARVPVIALTADAMRGDDDKYLAQGMDGYVSKPIDQQILAGEITRLLASRKGT